MIFATCLTIAAVLASSPPGETIGLTGTCPASITIARTYEPRISIEAHGADVAGVIVTGGGIDWRGGTIRARDGYEGRAQGGYGFFVQGGRNVTIEGVKFVEAGKAMVLNSANNIAIRFNRVELGQDGVIASQGSNIDISHNEFIGVITKPTRCITATETIEGLSRSICTGRGGVWFDGWHQDAIQYRNGIDGLTIIGNRVDNVVQGIPNMDGTGDRRVNNVLIYRNYVGVTGYHGISDYNSTGRVLIARNTIVSLTPGRKVPIRAGATAIVCENIVARAGDPGAGACP